MPRGDGTGPMGFGPMTGRGAGYCAGYGMPGFMNPAPGLGMGARFGRGRGWRNMYYATGLTGRQRAAMGWYYGASPAPEMSRERQAEALKDQADFLEQQLDAVRTRMQELSAQDDAKKTK